MTRLRIAGPRAMLDPTLGILQDAEVVHLASPSLPAAERAAPTDRETRHLRRVLADTEGALAALDLPGAEPPARTPIREPASLPRAAHHVGRVRRDAERIARARAELADERALLLRYEEFFRAFEALLGHELAWPDGHAFYVIVRAGAADVVQRLRASLEAAVDGQIELVSRPLASGESAVLIVTSAALAEKVGKLLATSHVEELPAPMGLGEPSLLRAMPALRAKLAALAAREGELESRRQRLREEERAGLLDLRFWLHDRLLVLEARSRAHAGSHLFVLEGWIPVSELRRLAGRVRSALGPEVIVEPVATEPWMRADAPVALSNPALFRPFEIITRRFPLPRYGTIDPTPFVAVFFPMFFGLMVGDVGLALLLAVLALVLRLRSTPGTTLRSVSAVAGACAAFSAGFGVLFGELFGDLGRRAFGIRPLGFDRETSIVPFLVLAASIGVVHVLLGLVLAVVNAWRHGERRHALGRGVAALMVALTVMAILVAFEVLPRRLFTPVVVALLLAFPVLVLLEGVVAVIELLGNFGQALSYVRIMAVGTASLMLAVVANRMFGAMGSALVGALFALLFHLVNFALGVFSPTIHALRLHYVEFFGRFFSAGGTVYEPLAHWHAAAHGR